MDKFQGLRFLFVQMDAPRMAVALQALSGLQRIFESRETSFRDFGSFLALRGLLFPVRKKDALLAAFALLDSAGPEAGNALVGLKSLLARGNDSFTRTYDRLFPEATPRFRTERIPLPCTSLYKTTPASRLPVPFVPPPQEEPSVITATVLRPAAPPPEEKSPLASPSFYIPEKTASRALLWLAVILGMTVFINGIARGMDRPLPPKRAAATAQMVPPPHP